MHNIIVLLLLTYYHPRGMLEEQIFTLKKASESRLESLKKEAVAVREH